MASEPLTSIVPYVLTELRGCEQGLILQTARDVIAEFHRRTSIWLVDLDAMNIVTDVTDYDLESPESCGTIHQVREVKYDDAVLRPDNDYRLKTGEKDVLELQFDPTADVVAGLEIKALLRLCRTADYVCKRQFCDYYLTWAEGIMAKLQAQPGQDWTNLQSSVMHKNEWNIGVSQATIDASRQNLHVNLRMAPQFPFIPRRQGRNPASF